MVANEIPSTPEPGLLVDMAYSAKHGLVDGELIACAT